ncbi:MAG TPA: Gfo/Idh/MocA family oxidoreductase [Candidatus Dormibacteraeota bacterium]|jgi:myo-inositol 2-dehydrogenase/D-chiro-inositol 1-dehydrogenase
MHVGLIGTGRIGAFHARSLRGSGLVDRLTVTDLDSARASKVATEVGAEHSSSPQAMLAAGIEALVIAAATPAHAELLRQAADATIPTFCEKPIALDLEATDDVIEHVRRSGAFVQIGFQRRFDAGYRSAREAVRSGAVGDVHLVRMATHDPAPPPEAYVSSSGGIWRDLAIHDFDIGSWVVGRPVEEVYADGEANDPLFARHEDVDAACAVLRFEGGAMGVVTAARNDPRGYDVRMEVFGLRDSVAVGADARTPLRSLEVGVAAPGEVAYADFLDRFQDAYRSELHAFLAAVEAGDDSPCSVEEARRALVVALAADRSRREHRPVRIAELG